MRKITFTIMNEERWLPIVGYEGYYEVSDHGRIKGMDRIEPCKGGATRRRKGVVLKLQKDKNGYSVVQLSRPGAKLKTLKVHRLVLGAFNPIEGMDELEVRHGDDTPSNNVLTNLSWGTRQDNIDDCTSKGRQARGRKNNHAKLTPEAVRLIRHMRSIGFGFITIAESLGLTPGAIYQVDSGRTWKHI